MRYFAMTASQECRLIPGVTNDMEACLNPVDDAELVFSEDELRCFMARALDALGEGRDLDVPKAKLNLAISGLEAPFSIYDLTRKCHVEGGFATWAEVKARITHLRGFEHNLCVDGHTHADPESNWDGEGQFPPFAIFDIDLQENLQPYYATRAQAEMAMARILKEG